MVDYRGALTKRFDLYQTRLKATEKKEEMEAFAITTERKGKWIWQDRVPVLPFHSSYDPRAILHIPPLRLASKKKTQSNPVKTTWSIERKSFDIERKNIVSETHSIDSRTKARHRRGKKKNHKKKTRAIERHSQNAGHRSNRVRQENLIANHVRIETQGQGGRHEKERSVSQSASAKTHTRTKGTNFWPRTNKLFNLIRNRLPILEYHSMERPRRRPTLHVVGLLNWST